MSPPYNIVSIPSHDSCIPEKQFAVQDEYTRHIIEGVRDCRSLLVLISRGSLEQRNVTSHCLAKTGTKNKNA